MNAKKVRMLVLALTLVMLFCGCGHQSEPGGTDRILGGTESSAVISVEEAPEPEPEYIVYPGFTDKIFTAENHMLTMANSAKNKVDFVFVVTNYDGSELFTSEPVAPGEKTQWDVTERWHGRSHTIQITATPILEDGQEGNASTQEITITINL